MTAPSALAAALQRQPPRMGGFSPAIVRLEVRRLLRNRRTMLLALVLPVLLFLGFGRDNSYVHEQVGRGNESAVVMISIALYGAVNATAIGGARVSIERASGWSRQLRVTPLSSPAYIVIKMAAALVLSAAAVTVVYLLGAVTNNISMPVDLWVITGLYVWVGSLLFAACGLFIGYLLPAENVMQIMGLSLTLCSFAGGLLVPLSQFSHDFAIVAEFTPLYGLNQLVHYPVVGGNFDWLWSLNVIVWLAIFVVGAAWRLRRDTARVCRARRISDRVPGTRLLAQEFRTRVSSSSAGRSNRPAGGRSRIFSARRASAAPLGWPPRA